METTRRNQILAIGAVVLLALIGGYYVFFRPVAPITPGQETSTSTLPEATTTPEISTTTTHTIKVIPLTPQAPVVPDYNAPISFAASVSADVRTSLNAQAATLRTQLSNNLQDFHGWIDLGNVYKRAGDYAGAAKFWAYASLMWPTNIVSFNNLADLYMNFVPDYPKAEANYLVQVANNPGVAEAYRDLFDLYTTTSYVPTPTAAEDILKKGIVAVPKAVELQVLLARYYKAHGRTAEASTQYDAAIANAKAQGNTTLATQLEQEKAGQ